MIQEAMEYIAALASKKIHTAHDRSYVIKSDGSHDRLPGPDYVPQALEFHSLSGLVDYVAAAFDDKQQSGSEVIIVDAPDRVRFVGELFGDFQQRKVFACAAPWLSPPFEFGRYLDIEKFVTQLQACFVGDEHTAAILRVVGNIKQNNVATFADDGVTQTVVAQAGLVRVDTVAVPNPVLLRPFRTFPEIDQPASKYVLRMKQDGDDLPTAALFEVTDNRWKHEAVERISKRLGELLDTAGSQAQVFA